MEGCAQPVLSAAVVLCSALGLSIGIPQHRQYFTLLLTFSGRSSM